MQCISPGELLLGVVSCIIGACFTSFVYNAAGSLSGASKFQYTRDDALRQNNGSQKFALPN